MPLQTPNRKNRFSGYQHGGSRPPKSPFRCTKSQFPAVSQPASTARSEVTSNQQPGTDRNWEPAAEGDCPYDDYTSVDPKHELCCNHRWAGSLAASRDWEAVGTLAGLQGAITGSFEGGYTGRRSVHWWDHWAGSLVASSVGSTPLGGGWYTGGITGQDHW